jgi:glutamate/aspartate transport system permease protein
MPNLRLFSIPAAAPFLPTLIRALMAGELVRGFPARGDPNVLLPMAFRIILPPLTSEFLNVIKNSAVALTIGLMELTARARAMQEFSFQTFEAFTAATVIYILINIAVTFGMRLLERRTAVPGFIGTAPQPAATH